MKFQRRKEKSRYFLLLLFLVLLSAGTAGCEEKTEESAYHIEYLNKNKERIVKAPYEPEASDVDGMVQEFLAALSSDPDDVEYRKPIPNDVEVTDYLLDGVLLSLNFDADYSDMAPVEEILCRAAVVRTLTQIDGVDCVAFFVGDTPLMDSKGNIIGNMNQESFIENPGEQINSIQETDLTLYFANEAGDGLIREVREDVYYSSNISLEKLVMEQLLMGPKVKGAKSAIPEGTKLVTVSVVDGVCYVSLDDTFKNQDYKVNEAIVIYSIVDSLTELPTINKVQITVNGDTKGVYRDNFPLNEMYDQNLDYVVGNQAEENTEGKSAEKDGEKKEEKTGEKTEKEVEVKLEGE